MLYWLAYALGVHGANDPTYLAWSGVIPGSAVALAAGTWYWRHRCPVERCKRVGRRRVGDSNYVACRRHHPRWTERVTPELLAAIPPRDVSRSVG